MPSRFEIRAITPADLGTVADTLVAGFATYRLWADMKWTAPTRLEMLTGLVQRFTRDGSFGVIAFDGSEPVGHAMARPERDGDEQAVEGVTRLTHLFVREPYWGSGVADELHGLIVDAMAQRSFGSARLWTPTGQARARAFYERRGWRVTGASDLASELGMALIEYELQPLT